MRNEHSFTFRASEIAKAAQSEHDYHKERVVHWKGEQRIATVRAKKAGVEVREEEVTGGVDVQVILDPSVTLRLSACARKIRGHQDSADRFQIEAAAYGSQAVTDYELDPDDVVYFRLAGGPRET